MVGAVKCLETQLKLGFAEATQPVDADSSHRLHIRCYTSDQWGEDCFQTMRW